tara:strand:+ start:19409 stop:21025 length:1617 start_codon:yes stop_codon:yes gene_type:complete
MQHHLNNALPIVAAAYGHKFGVQVCIEGSSAYTDGNRIVIPAADPATPDYRDLAWGFLAHEAAHIRHTDFEVVETSTNRPIRKAVLNIIEDIRIEQALGHDYPGTRKTLHQLVKCLIDQGQIDYTPAGQELMHPAALLQTWLLFRLRSRVLKQETLNPLYQQVNQDIRQQLPAGLMTRIAALANTTGQLTSTQDALQLTDALIKLIEEEKEEEQEPQPSNNKNNGINNLNSDRSDDDNTPDNNTTSALQSLLSATDDDLIPDLQQAAASALGDQAESAQHHHSSPRPFTLPTAEPAMAGSQNLLTKVAAESGMIRARLQGLVQASQQQRSRYKHTGRRLSPTRLAASQTGNTRIFSHEHKRTASNAVIYLLVDASGSMSLRGEKDIPIHQIANEAALALALALEGIAGVNCGAGFFPGRQTHIDSALPIGQSVRSHAAYFDQSPRGTTPMAEALWYAASQLIYRQEERKIIMVITDGEPDHQADTQDIISLCERSGIELVGVGIQTDSVERLFKSSVTVLDLASLRSSLFEVGKAAIG